MSEGIALTRRRDRRRPAPGDRPGRSEPELRDIRPRHGPTPKDGTDHRPPAGGVMTADRCDAAATTDQETSSSVNTVT